MTATRTPVEVANAHMIGESHRRMVDAGTIDLDELLEAAEVLAAEVQRLRGKLEGERNRKRDVLHQVYQAQWEKHKNDPPVWLDPSTPTPGIKRGAWGWLLVLCGVGGLAWYGLWELGGWVLR
jgi:hypothetical protein